MTPETNIFPWDKYVGHAVLVNRNPAKPHINPRFNSQFEYLLAGLSPSGRNLRFQTMTGSTFWAEHDAYFLLEDLGTVETDGGRG